MAAKFHNLVGTQWGWLTVIRHQGFDMRRRSLWLARCRCNREITVRSDALTRFERRSCGDCLIEYKIRAIFTEVTRGEPDQSHFG
jgi:hypothetical protein